MKQTLTILAALAGAAVLNAAQVSVTLDEAIRTALENNNALKISRTEIAIARAQYEQAMSAHYPSIDLQATALRADEALTFDMRGSAITPASVVAQQLLGTAGLIDAALVAQGLLPTATPTAQGMIAGGLVTDQTVPFTGEVTVAGRDTAMGRLSLLYPIYTGGKISAIVAQAKLGEAVRVEQERRARSQVVFDVKKYYYGAMLLREIKQLVGDTGERMGFTRDLTESLYKGGSMNVKKTDYLRTKLTVDLIASMYEEVALKEQLALSALANAMGLSWTDTVEISQEHFDAPEMGEPMGALVEQAVRFNPQMATLKLALQVDDARIDEAQSGYLPSLAFNASVQTLDNDYKYGMVNEQNKNSWTIGVGMEWNLFNGMRTGAEVEQRRLEKRKHSEQLVLLEEGTALQMRHAFLALNSSYRQYGTLSSAAETASQNRDLNTRAYQEDMVKTEDVIMSQVMESVTKSNLFAAMHAYAMAKATADFLAGSAAERAQE